MANVKTSTKWTKNIQIRIDEFRAWNKWIDRYMYDWAEKTQYSNEFIEKKTTEKNGIMSNKLLKMKI